MNHTTDPTGRRITPTDAMPDGSVRNPFPHPADISDATYVPTKKKGMQSENPADRPVIAYSER